MRLDGEGSDMAKVTISDCGIGLAPDTLSQMFTPFYTTKSRGLGMGLAISQSIIEAHGGRIWAENNAERGAAFYFTLPLAGRSGARVAVK
jgi:two-component system sensor kinase FixL